MAEKKQSTVGWADLLVEGVFGGIRQAVHGAVQTAERYVGRVTKRVAERLIFTFCALVGIIYVLSGAAEWVNAHYAVPGMGGFVVGGTLLIVALFLYLTSRNA